MVLKYPVILASGSPRRHDLLKEMGVEFRVVKPDVDEESLVDDDPWITAQRLAKVKAQMVFRDYSDHLVIAGDTVVAFENENGHWEQLAKPNDAEDAKRMLGILSGQTHTVITGVCVKSPGGFEAFTESSKVTFHQMSETEIEEYVATGEPLDKAGAYGLQGGARPFITQVEGSVNNVIGLPTERLEEVLREY